MEMGHEGSFVEQGTVTWYYDAGSSARLRECRDGPCHKNLDQHDGMIAIVSCCVRRTEQEDHRSGELRRSRLGAHLMSHDLPSP